MDELIIEYRKQNEGIINDFYLDELNLVFGIEFDQLPEKLKKEYNQNKFNETLNISTLNVYGKRINKEVRVIECDYSPINYSTIIKFLDKNYEIIKKDKRKEIYFFNHQDFEIDVMVVNRNDAPSSINSNYNLLLSNKQVKLLQFRFERIT